MVISLWRPLFSLSIVSFSRSFFLNYLKVCRILFYSNLKIRVFFVQHQNFFALCKTSCKFLPLFSFFSHSLSPHSNSMSLVWTEAEGQSSFEGGKQINIDVFLHSSCQTGHPEFKNRREDFRRETLKAHTRLSVSPWWQQKKHLFYCVWLVVSHCPRRSSWRLLSASVTLWGRSALERSIYSLHIIKKKKENVQL